MPAALLTVLLLLSVLLLLPGALRGQEKPDNIILLIGDGMGLAHVSALLLAKGSASFSAFPVAGFSVTTSASHGITESAAGASALSTAHKVTNGSVAMDDAGHALPSLLERARHYGKATGVVVTSSITHATPAAFLAHCASRSQEYDIALQIADGATDVLIGGGLRYFLPEQRGGSRPDSLDLLARLASRDCDTGRVLSGFVAGRKQLRLLADDALPPAGSRPVRLSEMVDSALRCLDASASGFVLVVEGSQIDWASHDNDCAQLLREMEDFDGAIAAALAYRTSHPRTLVLVLADHETGGLSVIADGDQPCAWTGTGHTACLVPVFAAGPAAERFGGIHQNNEIGGILLSLVEP